MIIKKHFFHKTNPEWETLEVEPAASEGWSEQVDVAEWSAEDGSSAVGSAGVSAEFVGSAAGAVDGLFLNSYL